MRPDASSDWQLWYTDGHRIKQMVWSHQKHALIVKIMTWISDNKDKSVTVVAEEQPKAVKRTVEEESQNGARESNKPRQPAWERRQRKKNGERERAERLRLAEEDHQAARLQQENARQISHDVMLPLPVMPQRCFPCDSPRPVPSVDPLLADVATPQRSTSSSSSPPPLVAVDPHSIRVW